MLLLVKQYWWLGFCLAILLTASRVTAAVNRPKLLPPAQSLTGQVASVSGLVRVKLRDEAEDQTIDQSRTLVDGETLVTSPSANLALNFNQVFQVMLSENSELSLSNLIKDSLVVQQRAGEAIYQTADQQKLGIRVGRLLILLDSGQVKVIQESEQIKIEVLAGEAKLGYVDRNNQTQVITIKSGQRVGFILAKRTIVDNP